MIGCEACVDGLQADGETPCPCQDENLPMMVRNLKRELEDARTRELEHSDTIRHLKTDRDRYAAALRIIAGIDHCIDGLMGNVDVARVALRVTNSEEKK